MRYIETLIRTIYTLFCRSSTKQSKFEDIANILEYESVAFRPVSEVRWLSRHFAQTELIRNYDPLLKYFEGDKSKDPVSKYCYTMLNKLEIRINLEILNNVFQNFCFLVFAVPKALFDST